jgi:hypothetical protein
MIEEDSRFLQRRMFANNALDTDGVTGAYTKSVTDPQTAEETLWWDNAESPPGANKGANASGYATSYD